MGDNAGRFGTLRLISSKTSKVTSSFPVDTDSLSFGRDPSCDVRMYFVSVAPLHAKLVFEHGKPLLSVMGKGGIILDGQPISNSTKSGEPVIVPLHDKATFVIHNKTFRFDYPQQQQRPPPMTPAPKARRSVRMSIVNAALLMTPNTKVTPLTPSLEDLHSPLRPFQRDGKSRSERDQEVILAEGDSVLVLKHGEDLVVTETLPAPEESESQPDETGDEVEEPARGRSPSRTPLTPTQSSSTSGDDAQPPPSQSRSRSRFSLHRAVLVRNSQRALVDRTDEDEVTRVVSPERQLHQYQDYEVELDDEDVAALEDQEEGDVGESDGEEMDEEPAQGGSAEEDENGEQEEAQDQSGRRRSVGLRASIGAIGQALISPFAGRWSTGPKTEEEDDEPADPTVAEHNPEASFEDAPVEDQSMEEDDNDELDASPHRPDADEPMQLDEPPIDDSPEFVDEDAENLPLSSLADSATAQSFVPHDDEAADEDIDAVSSPYPILPARVPSASPQRTFATASVRNDPPPVFTPPPKRNYQRDSLGGMDVPPSTARSRRTMRFSNFGLPDYIVNTTIADDDEEVAQVMGDDEAGEQRFLGNPTTPPSRSASGQDMEMQGTPETYIPPNLDSLRKITQNLLSDNAQRATRLSLTPARPQAQASPFRSSAGFGATPLRSGFSARQNAGSPIRERDANAPRALSSDSNRGTSDDSDESSDDEDGENLPLPAISAPALFGRNKTPTPSTPSTSRPKSPLKPISPRGRTAPSVADSAPTPSFAGFRNLFAPPPEQPQTPSFQGMRNLFAPPPATPNFGGMDDMFTTPPAQQSEPNQEQEQEEQAEEEREEARDATPKPIRRRFHAPPAEAASVEPAATSRARSSSRSRKGTTPAAASAPSLPSSTRTRARSRSRQPDASSSTPELDTAPARNTRARSASVAPRELSEEAAPAPPKRSSSRRKTPAPEVQQPEAVTPTRANPALGARLVEVSIPIRSPKKAQGVRKVSGSKRVYVSETESDAEPAPAKTSSSSRRTGTTTTSARKGKAVAAAAAVKEESMDEDEALATAAEEEEDTSPSASGAGARKRARTASAKVLAMSSEATKPVAAATKKVSAGSRLPVPKSASASTAASASATGTARTGLKGAKKAPPRDKTKPVESDSEEEAESLPRRGSARSATTAAVKTSASTSKIPKTLPAPAPVAKRATASARKATATATPAPAPVGEAASAPQINARSLRARATMKR